MPIRRSLVPALPPRAVLGAAAVGCAVGATAVYRLDLAVALVVFVSCVIGVLLVLSVISTQLLDRLRALRARTRRTERSASAPEVGDESRCRTRKGHIWYSRF